MSCNPQAHPRRGRNTEAPCRKKLAILLLRTPDRIERSLRREMSKMTASARALQQAQISLHDDRLRRGGNAHQSESVGERTLVHVALFGERTVFRMLDNKRIKAARISENARHDARVLDDAFAIGKAERTAFLQQAHLRNLFPPHALRRRRVAVDLATFCSRPRRATNSTTETSSMTGCVEGRQTIEVTPPPPPPQPQRRSSPYALRQASRSWTRISTSPGASTHPERRCGARRS